MHLLFVYYVNKIDKDSTCIIQRAGLVLTVLTFLMLLANKLLKPEVSINYALTVLTVLSQKNIIKQAKPMPVRPLVTRFIQFKMRQPKNADQWTWPQLITNQPKSNQNKLFHLRKLLNANISTSSIFNRQSDSLYKKKSQTLFFSYIDFSTIYIYLCQLYSFLYVLNN